MSHKGNKLIIVPKEVQFDINSNNVSIKGTLGQICVSYPNDLIKIEKKDNSIKVNRVNDDKQTKMYHGTVNANITNAIIGVSKGFKKTLKIVGVGYKAAVQGNKLILNIGFSHTVDFEIPKELKVTCPSLTQIDVFGFDKILVGEFAAKVRVVRPPEPYKGKGIMYENEHIIRKVGKTAESTSASTAKNAKK